MAYRVQLDRIFAERRTERERWMALLPAELRALLPLDATPITEGLALLADAVGLGETLRAEQRAQAHANPAVLHGRVFGRGASLSPETALAAFADGARVREPLLLRLAEAVDGRELRAEIAELLAAAPAPATDAPAATATDALADLFAAQELALGRCAERLDEIAC